MYDNSEVGKPYRSWCCVQLGTWHSYKQACTVVWGHWAARVFAPLYNFLINNANFRKKARLTTIARFLTYVRLAYPFFRQELKDTISEVRAANLDNVAKTQLYDLTKLLVYFIPVVCITVVVWFGWWLFGRC